MTDDVTGRAKGGKARAENLTPEQRSEIARAGALARWEGVEDLPKATHTGKLPLGDAVIPCAVLEDQTRLLTQAGFLRALGRSAKPKGRSQQAADGLPPFLATVSLKSLITPEIIESTVPVVFRTESGSKAFGYRAELLPKVCNLFLAARAQGKLTAQQEAIADKCQMLVMALAETGITALVDEATGYQDARSKTALQDIFNAFLRKELAAWVQRFPEEFYREIFRLRGWEWKGMKVNRPQIVAYYTVDLVYSRLLPHIMDELESRMPRTAGGRRKGALHQLFSDDVGHPALAQHIYSIISIMRLADDGDWPAFMRMVERAHPKKTDRWLKELMQGGNIDVEKPKATNDMGPLFAALEAENA